MGHFEDLARKKVKKAFRTVALFSLSRSFCSSSSQDGESIKCSACHKSCQTLCTGSGPKGCVDCKSGYLMDPERGCADIDECKLSEPCKGEEDKFCENTEGSFRCAKCHRACQGGCDGAGPGGCKECAHGRSRNDLIFDTSTLHLKVD